MPDCLSPCPGRHHEHHAVRAPETDLRNDLAAAGCVTQLRATRKMTELVIVGTGLIGLIGYGTDMLMRVAEKYLNPSKGRF